MARLFTYGKLNRTATIPGNNFLPGTYFTAYGIQYGAGAFNTTTLSMEPGEVVEIVSASDKGYSVKRATSSITEATAGVVLRDVMGVRTIEAGVFEEYIPGVPMSFIPFSAPVGWSVSVPVVAGQTPAVGGTIYIGKGSGSSILGGVYAAAQGGGSDTVALTNWKFASVKYTPTSDASLAAIITRV
jgi:hypothetical protein